MSRPASSMPTLPPELWDLILGHLCRITDVHINMQDGRRNVTFLTRKGLRRGDSFFVHLDELPPLDDGAYSGEWGNYYRFRLFRRSSGVLNLAPVTTACSSPVWAAIGRVHHARVPLYHGHAVSRMFRAYVSTQVVLSRSTLVAHAECGRFPEAFATVGETAFAMRGTGDTPFDMVYSAVRAPTPSLTLLAR